MNGCLVNHFTVDYSHIKSAQAHTPKGYEREAEEVEVRIGQGGICVLYRDAIVVYTSKLIQELVALFCCDAQN